MSQSSQAIQSRLYRERHPDYCEQQLLSNKKQKRRKRAVTLLQTRTLCSDFVNRGDEFIEEYVACSNIDAAKSKWFLDD